MIVLWFRPFLVAFSNVLPLCSLIFLPVSSSSTIHSSFSLFLFLSSYVYNMLSPGKSVYHLIPKFIVLLYFLIVPLSVLIPVLYFPLDTLSHLKPLILFFAATLSSFSTKQQDLNKIFFIIGIFIFIALIGCAISFFYGASGGSFGKVYNLDGRNYYWIISSYTYWARPSFVSDEPGTLAFIVITFFCSSILSGSKLLFRMPVILFSFSFLSLGSLMGLTAFIIYLILIFYFYSLSFLNRSRSSAFLASKYLLVVALLSLLLLPYLDNILVFCIDIAEKVSTFATARLFENSIIENNRTSQIIDFFDVFSHPEFNILLGAPQCSYQISSANICFVAADQSSTLFSPYFRYGLLYFLPYCFMVIMFMYRTILFFRSNIYRSLACLLVVMLLLQRPFIFQWNYVSIFVLLLSCLFLYSKTYSLSHDV